MYTCIYLKVIPTVWLGVVCAWVGGAGSLSHLLLFWDGVRSGQPPQHRPQETSGTTAWLRPSLLPDFRPGSLTFISHMLEVIGKGKESTEVGLTTNVVLRVN